MSDVYRTTDLNYAAYLRVADVPFLGAELETSRRVAFLFEDQGRSAMRDLRKGYFSGTAKVSALTYVQMLRSLKSLTFEVLNGG